MNWERWARGAGAGFVVLTVAAFIVGGDAPRVGDSTDDLISYYDGDRGKVLVSGLLFAFGLALLLWFAAAIANTLREVRRRTCWSTGHCWRNRVCEPAARPDWHRREPRLFGRGRRRSRGHQRSLRCKRSRRSVTGMPCPRPTSAASSGASKW